MRFSCFWKLQFSMYTSIFDGHLYSFSEYFFICIARPYPPTQRRAVFCFHFQRDVICFIMRRFVVAFRIVVFYEAFLQLSAGFGTNYDNRQPIDFFFFFC